MGNIVRMRACIVIFLLLFSVIASSSSLLFGAKIQSAFASDSNPLYENSKYGVKVHYPSDWEKDEYESNYFVQFFSQYEDKFDTYQENVGIFTQIVDPSGVDATLKNFVDSYMKKVQAAYTDFLLQNTTDSTLAGSPAMTVYSSQLDYDKDGKPDQETMRIFTIKDNRAYVFIYTAVTGRYSTYLSVVQNMLSSLEIDTSHLTKVIPSATQQFENSTAGIKASYPATWELATSSSNGLNYLYSPLESDADQFDEFMTIDVDKLQEQETLQQYVDSFIAYFKDDKDFQLLDSGQTTLAEMPGQKVILTYTGYNNEVVELTGSFALKGNYVYSVLFTGLKAQFSDYKPIAQSIEDSMQITSSPSLDENGPPASTLLTYTNSVYGVSIKYPNDWQKTEGDELYPNEIVIFRGTPVSYFDRGAYVSISFEGVSAGFSLQDYASAVIEGLKNSETYKVTDLKSSQTTLGGKPASRIEFILPGNDTGNGAKILEVAGLNDNKLYLITYASSSDSYDKDLPTVEEMIKSFQYITSSVDLSETKEYLSYLNLTSGINVSYPDNWRKSERIGNGVTFFSPRLDALVRITYVNLNLPGTTLVDVKDEASKDLERKITLFNQLESNSTAIGNGLPALKLVYTGIGELFEINQPLSIKVMQVWTIKDTRLFVITYSTSKDLYSRYLPVAEKIMDSLQLDSKSFPKYITGHYENLDSDFQVKVPDHWRGLEGKEGNITRAYFAPDSIDTSYSNSSTQSSDTATIVISIGSQKDFLEDANKRQVDDMKCDHDSSADAVELNGEAKALVFVGDCHSPKISKYKTYLVQAGDKSIYIGLIAPSAGAFQNSLSALDETLSELHLSGAVDITDVKEYADSNNLKYSKHTVKAGDKEFDLDIATNSDVGIFRLDNQTRTLSFEVGGKEGTNGETYFEIGKSLSGPYSIMVDNEPMDDNGILVINDKAANKTFLSLTYGHSTHTISVQGTNVVPEYPMPIYFVTLAISVALLTAISIGRRRSIGQV